MEKNWQKNLIGERWEEPEFDTGYRTSLLQSFSKVLTNFQTTQKQQGKGRPAPRKPLRKRKIQHSYPLSEKQSLIELVPEKECLPSFRDAAILVVERPQKNTPHPTPDFKARISERKSKYLENQQLKMKQKEPRVSPVCIAVLDPNIRSSLDNKQKLDSLEAKKLFSESKIARQMSIFQSRQLARKRQRLRMQVFCLRQRIASFGKINPKLRVKQPEKKQTVIPLINEKEFEDIKMFRA